MPAPQHVYDAIKKAREEGEAWVSWRGFRFRIKPLVWENINGWDRPVLEGQPLDGMHFDAIVKSKRPGGIAMAWVDAYKDVGDRIRIWEGGAYDEFGSGPCRMAGWDQIVAVVAEKHDNTSHVLNRKNPIHLKHPCPTCKAEPGAYCRGMYGSVKGQVQRDCHKSRIRIPE